MLFRNQHMIVLEEGTIRKKRKSTRSNNILSTPSNSDTIKSTLDHRSMNKIFINSFGNVLV